MIALIFVIAIGQFNYAYGPYPFATELECEASATEILNIWSEHDIHGRITCSQEFTVMREWKR